MKTLILKNPIKSRISNSLIAPSVFRLHFPLRGSISFRQFSRYKCFHIPRSVDVSPTKAYTSAESADYGGWDDFELGTWSSNLGESNQLRNLLNSIGIDDKKHVFMFLSGLVCALAILRVKVSTIILFPASVLVFGIGFSFGFVKGGSFNELGSNKRRSKEEILKAYSGKLWNVADYFNEFDVKIHNLKNDIQRVIDSNRITVGDLENYVSLMESLRLSASNARNVVECLMDNVGNSLIENPKPSKREAGAVGFEWFQFLGSLFAEKSMASKPNKVKDDVKLESVDSDLNNKSWGQVSLPVIEDRISSSSNNRKRVPNQGLAQDSLNQDRGRPMRFVDSEEYKYENNILQFTDTHDISSRTSHGDGSEIWETEDNLLDSKDFNVRFKHTKTEASFVHKQLLHETSKSYRSSHNILKNENKAYRTRQFYEDESHMADHLSGDENEVISSSPLEFEDDVVFGKCLTEASVLLREAKDCIRSKDDEQNVEVILNRSAALLSQAIAMKPMSLLAVGQLGNTYLLHGELKLHVSRELRNLLAGNDPIIGERLQGKVLKGLDDQLSSRDKIVSLLINACEGCEDLLVRAGRKYQLALSIDGDDVRSLYNWGLALSFRAQLIADIGPEAALDADKLFLAAIDKFDAMMTKGNIHAPDALFRWGVTLQQRSRLRPGNSKEKVKLLQQAKRLYEDALHMDSKNLHVRHALSSCISELNHRFF